MMGMNDQAQDVGSDASSPVNSPSNSEGRPSPVTSGHDRAAPDMSGHLTIDEARAVLFNHGITRNERSVRRYCSRGDLICTKIDTVNGQRQYVINRPSLDIYITQQLQLLDTSTRTLPASAGRVRTVPALSDGDRGSEGSAGALGGGNELLELLREQLAHAKEQIAKKDEQIDRKDQQITSMLERDRETNVLIKELQGMLRLQAPQPDMSGAVRGDGHMPTDVGPTHRVYVQSD